MTADAEFNETAELPLGKGVTVLNALPCGLIALDKPHGLLSHPNPKSERSDGPSLLEAEYDMDGEFYHWSANGVTRRAWLVNRIDSPTSGVILLSTSEDVASRVKDLFLRRRVKKVYRAVVIGRPASLPNVWKDQLSKVVKGKGVRMVSGKQLEAATRIKILRYDPNGANLTLMELEPLSGRTHQLRVQCAMRGFPILGDRTYGKFSINRKIGAAIGTRRMFLHSHSVAFEFVLGGKPIRFSASSAMPDIFKAVVSPLPALRSL